jgi:hypothetical protein
MISPIRSSAAYYSTAISATAASFGHYRSGEEMVEGIYLDRFLYLSKSIDEASDDGGAGGGYNSKTVSKANPSASVSASACC